MLFSLPPSGSILVLQTLTEARLIGWFTGEQISKIDMSRARRKMGKYVRGVVNFPPRQIGKVMSEVLVLGFPDAKGAVVLMRPDMDIPAGGRLF